MTIKGDLKLKVKANPGLIASEVMRQGLYNTYTDALLDVAQEFQENSPVGATGDLKSSWDVQNTPRKVSYGFEVRSNIINTSDRASNRIAGRGAGKMPPIGKADQPDSGILPWVIAKGIASNPKQARGIAFAIARKIATEGTERHKQGDNWVGIDNKGNRIPGGRIEQAERAIAAKLEDSHR